jgi:hypothetical protein
MSYTALSSNDCAVCLISRMKISEDKVPAAIKLSEIYVRHRHDDSTFIESNTSNLPPYRINYTFPSLPALTMACIVFRDLTIKICFTSDCGYVGFAVNES